MSFGYKHIRNRNKKTVISSINVTPFVDVVLVLLIIFMITSPMLNNGYDVNLPKVSAEKININKQKQVIFSVDANRIIRVDDTKLSFQTVVQYLQDYTPENTQIFIKGDKNVSYGIVIELMSLVHSKGFNNISLVTDTINNK